MPNPLEVPPFDTFDKREPIEHPNVESGKKLAEYITDVVYPQWRQETERLSELGKWMEGKQPFCQSVRSREREKRALLELSRSPWLGLAVSIYAQAMYVDGYRSPGQKENAAPWKYWVANNFQSHQIAIHRAMVGYGYSYARVLPQSEDDVVLARGARPAPKMRGVSPKRMLALFDDPVGDDFPLYALEFMPDGKTWRWYDDNVYHVYENPKVGGKFIYKETVEHNIGVCPVVRYVNQMDLDGRCIGDVEPMIAIAARIDKTDYDRLLVQHFNSWKVRWATGIEEPDTEEGLEGEKRKLSQEDVLVSSDPNAEFGTLEETNLKPFIEAHESDVEALASMEQLPSHLFTGKVINVSAEALAASRAQTTQKLLEKQTSAGVSHARLLRLTAAVAGDSEAAADFDARVSWQDVEVRSLAQAADAYGKIAQQLGVPKQALWRFIPGVDATDVEEWVEMALDDDPLTKFLRDEFGQNMGGSNFAANATLANRSGRPIPDHVSPPTQ